MFAQIQNVVSGRDLYSSNPCRDFWDSQQFSQAVSGSQSSQQSSVELFSQSKSSQSQQQQRIGTSYDWWSNTGSSQQTNEEEPVKYYMKYLSKPPLFSEKSRKDQEKPQAENFKEFIEAQKVKTLERDQRDLLDSFIGLLKDYTKEVQTAMQSFEDSLGTSLATNNTNLEKMTSVAEKSFSVVDELKEDFDNRFNELRNDLKENEELKAIISKKEQELAKLDMEVQTQKKQLEEFKRREDAALKREEKYKRHEDQLLERIKEIESHKVSVFRDTPPPSQRQDLPVLQRNDTLHFDSVDRGIVISNPCFSRKDASYQHISYSSSAYPALSDKGLAAKPSAKNTPMAMQDVTETFHPCTFSKCYGSSQKENAGQTGSATGGFNPLYNAEPCSVIQTMNRLPSMSETSASAYPLPSAPFPTASIAPVQKSSSPTQCLPTAKKYSTERQITLPSSYPLVAVSPTIRCSAHPETLDERPIRTAPSPANKLSVLTKDKWPKHSPVATVLPQVQVKQQVTSHGQCLYQGKKQQEDPLGIFAFDLTTSPLFASVETDRQRDLEPVLKHETSDQSPIKDISSQQKKNPKKVMEKPLSRKYGTRSRGKIEESNSHEEIVPEGSSVKAKSLNQSGNCFPKPFAGLKRKVYSTVAANSKKKCYIGIRASTRNTDADTELDLSRIQDKTKLKQQALEKCSRSSFKRQQIEKRTLNLVGSSLFESMDEDVSIHQITESIRKHVQKRKIKQKP